AGMRPRLSGFLSFRFRWPTVLPPSGFGDRITAELYADPIQKARLSDPKQAIYPIQRLFSLLKRDGENVANPMKKATCNFSQVASIWRRGELNPRPVNPEVGLLRV